MGLESDLALANHPRKDRVEGSFAAFIIITGVRKRELLFLAVV